MVIKIRETMHHFQLKIHLKNKQVFLKLQILLEILMKPTMFLIWYHNLKKIRKILIKI
jgi:hypothetical protein